MDISEVYEQLFEDDEFTFKYAISLGLVDAPPIDAKLKLTKKQKELLSALAEQPNDFEKAKIAIVSYLKSSIRYLRPIDYDSLIYFAEYLDDEEIKDYANNKFEELRSFDSKDIDYIPIVGTTYWSYNEELCSLFLFLNKFGLANFYTVQESPKVKQEIMSELLEANPGIYSGFSLYKFSKFPQLVYQELRYTINRAIEKSIEDLQSLETLQVYKEVSPGIVASCLIALRVFAEEKSNQPEVKQAISQLIKARNSNGSWSIRFGFGKYSDKFDGDLETTIICAQALALYSDSNANDAFLDKTLEWIKSKQTPIGLFYDTPSCPISLTVGVLELLEILEKPRKRFNVFVLRKPLPSIGVSDYNDIICEVSNKLDDMLPHVTPKEKDTFLEILSIILQFIRYERKRGLLKSVGNMNEKEFNARLIAHLYHYDKKIITEQELGGGRLDILIDDVIIELKVDSSDRTKEAIIAEHENQLLTYLRTGSRHTGILFTLLSQNVKRTPSAIRDIYKIVPYKDSTGNIDSVIVALFAEANYGTPSSH
ncbi:MAG: hypothetical protein PWQ27_1574 [Kosmotoga sp.]|nr:hypothetical protein [Kosmotoga sp.]